MSTALEGSLFNYFGVIGASGGFDTLVSASLLCRQNHPAGVTSAKHPGPTMEVMARMGDVRTRTYEVVTSGKLNPASIGRLHGFDVTRVEGGRSYLVGTHIDRTKLHEVLEVLRSLSVELITIDAIPAAQRIERFTEL